MLPSFLCFDYASSVLVYVFIAPITDFANKTVELFPTKLLLYFVVITLNYLFFCFSFKFGLVPLYILEVLIVFSLYKIMLSGGCRKIFI